MDPRINFFIIGAAKSGTTSLFEYLRQHPDIFLPLVKENRFFLEDDFYKQGDSFLGNFYNDLQNEQVIGGACAEYLYFPHTGQRIAEYNQRIRLITVLRNPIDLAYSAYWFARTNGWESCGTFEEALKNELARSKGSFIEKAALTYLGHGHYYDQLKRWSFRLWSGNPQDVVVDVVLELKANMQRIAYDSILVAANRVPWSGEAGAVSSAEPV